jgi:hypothetical protein
VRFTRSKAPGEISADLPNLHPEGSANAIAAGLSSRASEFGLGYWINIGGTGILTYDDMVSGKLGDWSDKQYNDWSGIEDLTHLPDEAMHRSIDKIVLAAGSSEGAMVRTAIISPPTVYGTGRK